MLKSIIGNKIGMTQIFDEIGNIVPVTVIAAGPCIVTDIKTKEKNGYTAVQVAYGEVHENSLNKPSLGQFKKKNLPPKRYLKEFRVDDPSVFSIGQEIKADIFTPGEYVDVSGLSKGKGYAGTVKRHKFKGGVVTHGQSDRLRAPGSSGSQRPTHVIKGKRMAGHMGHEMVTVQKIKVVKIDSEKNVILLNGSVPGPNNNLVVIQKTVKKVKTFEEKQKGQHSKKKGKNK